MPSYPASVATVAVTGRWVYSDGSGAIPKGSVTFTPNAVLLDGADGRIIGQHGLTVPLDVNGAISTTLMATDDTHLAPSGWAYTITEDIAGVSRVYSAFFPRSVPTVDLSTVAAASSTILVGYVSLAAVGAPSGVASLDANSRIPLAQLGNMYGSWFDVDSVAAGAPAGVFGANCGHGTPHLQARIDNVASEVCFRGQILTSGAVTANAAMLTLPAGWRPYNAVQYSARWAGPGSANAFLNVSAAGVLSTNTGSLVSGDSFNLDGLRYSLT